MSNLQDMGSVSAPRNFFKKRGGPKKRHPLMREKPPPPYMVKMALLSRKKAPHDEKKPPHMEKKAPHRETGRHGTIFYFPWGEGSEHLLLPPPPMMGGEERGGGDPVCTTSNLRDMSMIRAQQAGRSYFYNIIIDIKSMHIGMRIQPGITRILHAYN